MMFAKHLIFFILAMITIALCLMNNFDVGFVMSLIIFAFMLISVIFQCVVKYGKFKGSLRKVNRFFEELAFTYMGGFLAIIFVLCFFTSAKADFKALFLSTACTPLGTNGCVRVAPFNQYRSKELESKHPVTYKNVDILNLVENYMAETYYDNIESYISFYEIKPEDHGVETVKGVTQRIFTTTTSFGLTIDTLVTIKKCTEVYSAQSVSIQS